MPLSMFRSPTTLPAMLTGEAAKRLRGGPRGEDAAGLAHLHTMMHAEALEALAGVEQVAVVVEEQQHRWHGIASVRAQAQHLQGFVSVTVVSGPDEVRNEMS